METGWAVARTAQAGGQDAPTPQGHKPPRPEVPLQPVTHPYPKVPEILGVAGQAGALYHSPTQVKSVFFHFNKNSRMWGQAHALLGRAMDGQPHGGLEGGSPRSSK